MNLTYRNVPSWLIMLTDLMVTALSLVLSYLVRFNFDIPQVELDPLPQIFALMLLVKWGAFAVARTHSGLLRYTSTHDAGRIVSANIAALVAFFLTNLVSWYGFSYFLIPTSIIIIEFFITTLFMILFRLVSKVAYMQMQQGRSEKQTVVVFGAGEAGIIAKNALQRDVTIRSEIAAFFDDDPGKVGKKLE
ncbi:MAG: hypothetical protein PHQ65_08175 [Bacteroidales bacterium]|nr:hypothetical protein [Bacteroidales bacterium]